MCLGRCDALCWIGAILSRKAALANTFRKGFPPEMAQAVIRVVSAMPGKMRSYISVDEITYFACNGTIGFPYRIHLGEIESSKVSKMSNTEKMILHCIYSRSCDGYVRQKHISELLSTSIPDWAIPYIVKVCDEYVVEILEMVYESLKESDTAAIKLFCASNRNAFCKSYNRMISYWDLFYRNDYCRYKDYVGYKLFINCFGATRTMACAR